MAHHVLHVFIGIQSVGFAPYGLILRGEGTFLDQAVEVFFRFFLFAGFELLFSTFGLLVCSSSSSFSSFSPA